MHIAALKPNLFGELIDRTDHLTLTRTETMKGKWENGRKSG